MTPHGSCPVCGGGWSERAAAVGGAEIWRCAGCGMGRTFPTPLESDGHEWFAGDPVYFARAHASPKDWCWHRFAEAPLNILEKAGAKPGLTLLDVGCNLGYLVAAAQRRGYRAWGVDASPAAAAFGRERLGLNVVCAGIESAPVDAGSQDVVVLNHVLEHLPDPSAALRKVRHWIRPEGFLLIGLPNFASPLARMFAARWAGLVPSQHIWHFTPCALVQVVADAGFVSMTWETCMLTYAPQGMAGWMKWIGRWGLERIRLADNLILVARRPADGKEA